jgi:hypothetical protein
MNEIIQQQRWGETPSSPNPMNASQPSEIGQKNPAAGIHVQARRKTIVRLTVTTEGRAPWLADEPTQRLFVCRLRGQRACGRRSGQVELVTQVRANESGVTRAHQPVWQAAGSTR